MQSIEGSFIDSERSTALKQMKTNKRILQNIMERNENLLCFFFELLLS